MQTQCSCPASAAAVVNALYTRAKLVSVPEGGSGYETIGLSMQHGQTINV